MKRRNTNSGESLITKLRKSDDPPYSLARDIAWVIAVVGAVALVLFLASGTWPAVVAIESESMVPNMNVGDLVFVAAQDRYGELQTWEDGTNTGYAMFANQPDKQGHMPYGDVIIYRPNGDTSVHPIIHRAIAWYDNTSEPGYLTKGDNNDIIDQQTWIKPVKKEWVIGKALFAIPFVGYLPLHIVEFAILIIALMVVHELIMRKRDRGNKRK